MNTEPCPPMPDGSPRQCGHCPEDIPIGAPAARNRYGTFVHPVCPSSEPARGAARAQADLGDQIVARLEGARGGLAQPTFGQVRTPAPRGNPCEVGDLGDQVVARLETGRGISREKGRNVQ